MIWLERLFQFLTRHEVFRFTTLAYVRIVSINSRFDEHRQMIYASAQPAANSRPGESDLESANDQGDIARRKLNDPRIDPRSVLRIFHVFGLFRASCNCYFVYIILKFYVINLGLLDALPLARPVHCYLAGRFVVHPSLDDVLGMLLAKLNLAWRLYHTLIRPYRLSIIEFGLLGERELDLIYSKLGPDDTITLSSNEDEHLSSRSRRVLETMCFRTNRQRAGSVYKLRPNRTRRMHDQYRRITALTTITCCSLFTAFLFILPALIVPHLVPNETYLRRFPHCDPRMEAARARGQLEWLTLTPHRLYAGAMDLVENVVMYTDCGFGIWVGMTCMFLLILDLTNLWKGIDAELGRLLDTFLADKLRRRHSIGPGEQVSDLDLRHLLAAICDFFEQVSRANELVSAFLVGFNALTLVACSLFTYFAHERRLELLPFEVITLLSVPLGFFGAATCGLLLVDHRCVRSYPKLCSLIAQDPLRGRHKYEQVLENYNHRRSCFTLLKHIPLLPTTFLAMIGWTFSSFCIISSMLRSFKVPTPDEIGSFCRSFNQWDN